MKRLGLLIIVTSGLLWGQLTTAQENCAAAFDDAQRFAREFIEAAGAGMEDGVIRWDSTDWENLVRRVVGTGEFYLNNCTDDSVPLSEQPSAVTKLAEMSQIALPYSSVDVGGDFGEVTLRTGFTPSAEFIDLNADGTDELLLHTQIPYFSQETVYDIRGGLSIAYFETQDGWQGQVIAPVSQFVTDETGDHAVYTMIDDSILNVASAAEALIYPPAPDVQVIEADGTPLTVISFTVGSPTGEIKELNILSWDGRFPNVELRVVFDDWCYPGRTLDWEIREDGSVFIPSNGGEEGSPLHCGRTPEALFVWDGDGYISEPA